MLDYEFDILIKNLLLERIRGANSKIAQFWVELTKQYNYKPDSAWMRNIMDKRATFYYRRAIDYGYVSFVEDMEPIKHKKRLGDWYIPYLAHRAINGNYVDHEIKSFRDQRLTEIINIIPRLDPVRTIFLPLLIGNESNPLPKIENI
jgi:hypothetical protein